MNNTPAPGWYPNQHGQYQWWDGVSWGPLASTNQFAQPAQQSVAAPPYPRRRVRPVPISRYVWASFGCTVLGPVAWLVPLSFPFPDSALGDVLEVANRLLIAAAVICAAAFAVLGLLRSQRRTWAVVALVISVLVPLSPIILVTLGWLLFFVLGASGQLAGDNSFG